MKKLWANVLVFCMIFSIFSFYSGSRIKISGAEPNKQASVIAVQFHLYGMDAYDNPIDEVPWKDTPDQVWWGRDRFLMPNAQLAQSLTSTTLNPLHIPATLQNNYYTKPVLWAIWYQNIEAKGGKSQESKPWYVILDDAGQMWLDPDGRFNDPRYDASADFSKAANYVAGSCASNPLTQIDNQPGNNTQGPYIMDPSYKYFDFPRTAPLSPIFQQNIFFWDNQRGGNASKRFWKIGWLDFIDYEVNEIVTSTDWDTGLDLIPFTYLPATPADLPSTAHIQEEFHVDLVKTFEGITPLHAQQYDYGEFIYQKGPGPAGVIDLKVQQGDIRRSWVVKTDSNGEQVTYEPLSIVGLPDLDLGMDLVPFVRSNPLTISLDDELHTDFGSQTGAYDVDEFIYKKKDGNSDTLFNRFVEVGDVRLTPVNTTRYTKDTLGKTNLKLNINNQRTAFGKTWLGGIWAGDVLLLNEVLEGGCNAPTYDITVQTDVWRGVNPSVVSARLRSPTGDIIAAAQDIQKSTVLDPRGDKFVIPATTFHNIRLGYREFVGVEIWKDDGTNNMFLPETTNITTCVPNNLSDDYMQKVRSEEYVGAINGSPDLDYGRSLSPFPSNILFHDANVPPDFIYGLGEGIYKKRTGNTLPVVQQGDIRVNAMRFDINGTRVSFKEGSIVTAGDLDLGNSLNKFPPNTMFFDEPDPWNSTNTTNISYDVWEDIYKVGTDVSDIYRLTSVPPNPPFSGVPLRSMGLMSNILYVDTDNSNTVSLGDIRLYNNPQYTPGSVVRATDTDVNPNPLITFNIRPAIGAAPVPPPIPPVSINWTHPNTGHTPTPLTSISIGIVLMDPQNPMGPTNIPRYAYADMDNDGRITVGDIRLTSVVGYKPGSIVSSGDTDAPYLNPPSSTNWVYNYYNNFQTLSVTNDTQVYIEISPLNTKANDADIRLTPLSSSSGVRRLTEVTIAGEKYEAGTRVSAGNVFKHQIKSNMIRVGANGNKRYLDITVLPGKLGMDVQFSSPLMVERTTEITVSVNPPPRKNERIMIYFYDIGNFDTTLSHIDTRIITASDPIAKMEFTPYRGSLERSGQYGSRYFRIQAFKVEDLPEGITEINRLIRPGDGEYIDPFWKEQMFRLGSLAIDAQLEFKYIKYLPTPRATHFNALDIPPFPNQWENIYDCFEERKEAIQPSPIAVVPDKKCLNLYEQRQPSFAVRLYDPDDPLDVNDPYSLPLSVSYLVKPQVYFNVHGGGIAYIFTTPVQATGLTWNRNIVQVNMDNTYFVWQWVQQSYSNGLNAADTLNFLGGGGPSRWIDNDCSEGTGKGDPNLDFGPANSTNKPPPFGDISFNDTFAGYIVGDYGVPMEIVTYSEVDEGGLGLIIARPTSSDTPVEVTIYSSEIMFDYNSSIAHPPYFRADYSQGIDYIGSAFLKVLPADPVLNYVDVNWVDHALQYSRINYNAGPMALSKMTIPPMPIIASRYNPILMDWQDDLRAYPGGQTNTGRVLGRVSSDIGLNDTGRASGFNAFPAVFSKGSARKRFTNNYNLDKEWQYDQFNKLGTEFYPMTDYGMYFILKDYNDRHYSFLPTAPAALQIKRITIKGPFATPKKVLRQSENRVYLSQPNNYYNELRKVPLQYDFSGEIIIDETNYGWYEEILSDFTTTTSPYYPISGIFSIAFADTKLYNTTNNPSTNERNPQLEYNKRLHYENARADATFTNSVPNCFVIDEIIPVNRGKITVEVELFNGIIRKFEDCCSVKQDGFLVHALDLKTDKDTFYPDVDQKVQVTLGEYEPKGYDPSYTDTVKECNNAVVVAWQDRGVYNPKSKAYDGAGDGWITRAPRSSGKTELAYQYDLLDDTNGDGKVSFGDFEIEICGSYDLASNTWAGGLIDARTFSRNDGIYNFDFSSQNGNQITTVGWDFGGGEIKGNVSPPDHVIANDETLPIYINAYKYGDDNNDRAFIYNLANVAGGKVGSDLMPFFELSHEVYLAAQTKIDVKPSMDLIVSATPDPLTSGVTPELSDPQNPLTFLVLDAEGSPVDLKYGVPEASGERIVPDRTILTKLIMDPHPDNDDFYGKNANLPQYYWLRTDLHNNDDTFISNNMLYSNVKTPFNPIEFDFREKDKGKYLFKGFCANDQGNFEVFVFTPDRKHAGKTTVKVVLPDVSYKVINTDDPTGSEFSVPGEPDFMLTAADNRLYKITAQVKNAQGVPMKGAGNTISVCGGSETETSRFTLMSTTPYNFGWSFDQPNVTSLTSPCWYSIYGRRLNFIYSGDAHRDSFSNVKAGYDYNNNGKIDTTNKELFELGGFRAYAWGTYLYCYYSGYLMGIRGTFYDGGWWTYYNTRNWMWDDGKFEIDPMFLVYPEPIIPTMETRWFNGYYGGATGISSVLRGWGLGCIYNSPHRFGYLFADLDKDKLLTYRDAFNLDKEGKVSFYLYPEDISSVGGLVGNNRYSNNNNSSDLYGNPGEYTADSPKDVTKRFRNAFQQTSTYSGYRVTTADNTYRLDWDSMPNRYLELKPPSLDLYDAQTNLPLGKEILSTDSYDISYGKSNRILIRAYPADRRDLPLQTGSSVVLDSEQFFPISVIRDSLYGPQSEAVIYGNLYESTADPKARETIITYTPTGTGIQQAFLQYWNRNTRLVYPNFFMVGGLASFDVAKGLSIDILTGDMLKSKEASKVIILVKESGANAPVAGATVSIEGLGVSDKKTTDSKGQAVFTLTPSNRGVLFVKATLNGLITGNILLGVEEDAKPQFIDLDPIDILPEQNTAILSGTVKTGSAVLINNQPVPVNENGKFRFEQKLIERLTTFEIIAKDATGRIAKKIITVEKPSENLQIALDVPDKYVEAKEVSIKGKVSKKNVTENAPNRAIWVFVNGVEAKVIPDEKYITFDFEATVPLAYGRNRIEINVRTADGFAKKVVEIPNYKKFLIELQIDNDVATINGNQTKIDARPYIAYGRTFVPLRVVAEGFGAAVDWVAQTKGINITLGDKIISMQIGSNRAIVNNQVITLDASPEIKNGRTYLPIRFVSEALGAEVNWNQNTRKVSIVRLTME